MSEFKRIQIQIKKNFCASVRGEGSRVSEPFFIKNVNIQNIFVVVVVVFIVE